MSGIAGIVHGDGAPVDRLLLRSLTEQMAYRGPDAQETWADGSAGFGHAMLRTTFEAEREKQPCSLDGEVWITADARVDAREELIRDLAAAGRRGVAEVTDPELILHAWHVWGEQCVKHLLGDFAFAIWDRARRRLFCARDHFGVKPFYYAGNGKTFIFSNTLSCMRSYPGIPDRLNDLAIADFLLFGFNQDRHKTSFAEIHQLAPAHYLTWSDGDLRVGSYWDLPYGLETKYKRTLDYVDHYGELLRKAVKDRLRTRTAGVYMSGGLDSTLVAAIAHESGVKIRAHTAVYDRVIPDEERKYAQRMADHLKIPIEFLACDDYHPFDAKSLPNYFAPEPLHSPMHGISLDLYRQLERSARVALTGSGGDPTLATNDRYIETYLRPGKLWELTKGLGWAAYLGRRIPRAGFRTLLRRKLQTAGAAPEPMPGWLNPDLVKRLGLTERWEMLNAVPPVQCEYAGSSAHALLKSVIWPRKFESEDAGMIGIPIEQRHPLFDVRVATYLLSIPSLPWRQEKILQMALGRGLVAEEVRRRRKTPLAGDPVTDYFYRPGVCWWGKHFQPAPGFNTYVLPELISRNAPEDRNTLWTDLRPLGLNYWLLHGRGTNKIAA